MPTVVSHSILEEIARLINEACEAGDNVSAIARRSGIDRRIISALRNGSYDSSPTVDKLSTILKAIGYEIKLERL